MWSDKKDATVVLAMAPESTMRKAMSGVALPPPIQRAREETGSHS